MSKNTRFGIMVKVMQINTSLIIHTRQEFYQNVFKHQMKFNLCKEQFRKTFDCISGTDQLYILKILLTKTFKNI